VLPAQVVFDFGFQQVMLSLLDLLLNQYRRKNHSAAGASEKELLADLEIAGS